MGNHSNLLIQKHIEDNRTLLFKMNDLTSQLEQDLIDTFNNTMGVPIPTALQADVREFQYDMVLSTDPLIDEYLAGARSVLQSAFAGKEDDIIDPALDVVQVLLNTVVGSGTIQTGGYTQSAKITSNTGKTYISACFTQVEECDARDWLFVTNFYVAYYLFVVWQSS